MSIAMVFSNAPDSVSTWQEVVVSVVGSLATLILGMRVRRNQALLKNLEKLPPEDRLPALRSEMGREVYLKEGMTATEYVIIQKNSYYFRAFLAVLVTILAVVGMKVYGSHREQINNYISKTINNIAMQTDAGTKTATPPDSAAKEEQTEEQLPDPHTEPIDKPAQTPPSRQAPNQTAYTDGQQTYQLPPQASVPVAQPAGTSNDHPVNQPNTVVVVTSPSSVQPPVPTPEPKPEQPKQPPVTDTPSDTVRLDVKTKLDAYLADGRIGHKAFAISRLGATGRTFNQTTEDLAQDKALEACRFYARTTTDTCYIWYADGDQKEKWPKESPPQ